MSDLIESLSKEFDALLKIEGAEADNHLIKAETLATIITALQSIAFLVGANDLKSSLNQRFKPTKDLKNQYTLVLGTPEKGSYAVPWGMNPLPELDLLPRNDFPSVFYGLLETVQKRSWEVLESQFGSSSLRKRVLVEILRLLPQSGDSHRITIATRNNQEPLTLSSHDHRALKLALEGESTENTVMTVTGDLIKIDFERRIVTIKYPPTGKALDCSYLPEFEDMIVTNRTGPIQVTGTFVLDDDGNPKSLSDVTKIEAIDLSPIYIQEVPLGESSRLVFKEALMIPVTLDTESSQYMVAELSELNIFAYTLNRDLLVEELENQIQFLWQNYGEAKPDELSEDAQTLRTKLRDQIRVEHHA